MLTLEQKKNRKFGIGASDCPIIMGYSNYKTPYQLYLEKTGTVTDEADETELQYWGNAIEPLILRRFEQENNVKISTPDTLHHRDYPFIFANLDGWIESERAVVEAKCANSFQRKEWDATSADGIPLNYLIQIASQVAVADAKRGYCAVLFGGNEYMQFVYERDRALEDLVINAQKEFWDMVQNRIEPPAINTNDCRLKYRNVTPDKMAQSTYKTSNSLAALLHVKAQMKSLSDEEDMLKMTLMSHMGDAEYLVEQHGEIIATWKANTKGTSVFNIK